MSKLVAIIAVGVALAAPATAQADSLPTFSAPVDAPGITYVGSVSQTAPITVTVSADAISGDYSPTDGSVYTGCGVIVNDFDFSWFSPSVPLTGASKPGSFLCTQASVGTHLFGLDGTPEFSLDVKIAPITLTKDSYGPASYFYYVYAFPASATLLRTVTNSAGKVVFSRSAQITDNSGALRLWHWKRVNQSGNPVRPGTYIMRITATSAVQSQTISKKVTVS